jgi:hypothetical protein
MTQPSRLHRDVFRRMVITRPQQGLFAIIRFKPRKIRLFGSANRHQKELFEKNENFFEKVLDIFEMICYHTQVARATAQTTGNKRKNERL